MSNEFFKEWSVKFSKFLIQDFKIDPIDCHAIMGNAGCESAGFKSLQELRPVVAGSKGGYGIMQWTGPRRRLYEDYCSRNGLNPTDMMSNYKFLFVELSGGEGKGGKVLERVHTANTLEAKVEVFMKEFLRPGVPNLQSRINWARIAQTAWQGQATVQPVSVEVPTPPVSAPVQNETAPQSPTKQTLLSILISILLALFGKR